MEIGELKPKCGLCGKFHTSKCPGENEENIRSKIFYQGERSDPISDGCFELGKEHVVRDGLLIELFTEALLEKYVFKHFVKEDSSLGLHVWDGGRYVPCGEDVKSCVEAMGLKIGLGDRIKTHLVNEVVEKLKRRTKHELKEEPLKISFKNYVFDYGEFLNGKGGNYLIPIEDAKEIIVFHHIPWSLNRPLLDKCMEVFGREDGLIKVAEEEAPEAVNVFRGWVGESWPLLFEITGYCLYPGYPFNKAFMLVGDGRNGKSTFLKLVRGILGPDNITAFPLQVLSREGFAQSELYHKLANIFPDVTETPIPYTGWFKALTGEDRISAPRKFKSSISFENYAKLLFSANVTPKVKDMSEAYWRRWIVIEFPNKFPDDPTFFEKTFTEEVIEKIIALSIMFFVNVWHNREFTVKGGAQEFKDLWLRRESNVYAYVKSRMEEGRIVIGEGEYTPTNDLYNDYISWCSDNDEEAKDKAVFTKELERHFKIRKRQRREMGGRPYVYEGIRLKQTEGKSEEYLRL
jgi:putative DNA primase/helicase